MALKHVEGLFVRNTKEALQTMHTLLNEKEELSYFDLGFLCYSERYNLDTWHSQGLDPEAVVVTLEEWLVLFNRK